MERGLKGNLMGHMPVQGMVLVGWYLVGPLLFALDEPDGWGAALKGDL
jgi:hypothetical protein